MSIIALHIKKSSGKTLFKKWPEDGHPDEEIVEVLERHNLKGQIQQFHDIYIRLDAPLKIDLARIEFIN